MRPALLLVASLVVLTCLAGCGSSSAAPKDDPAKFAVKVVNLILANDYSQAWNDLHADDQRVAPLSEYVGCETRTPILARPSSIKVLGITDQSVALGNGMFVESKAVDLRLSFKGNLNLTHTVHVVADQGKWRWILPAARFRQYKADQCPADAGSPSPPKSA